MKGITIFSVTLFATLLSLNVGASEPAGAPDQLSNGSTTAAGLAWRCGKNNPAMWGTFGNGCLKQKRNWGKQKSQANGLSMTTVSPQQPAETAPVTPSGLGAQKLQH